MSRRMRFGRFDVGVFGTYISYAASSLAVPVALVTLADDLHFPLDAGGMALGGLLLTGLAPSFGVLLLALVLAGLGSVLGSVLGVRGHSRLRPLHVGHGHPRRPVGTSGSVPSRARLLPCPRRHADHRPPVEGPGRRSAGHGLSSIR